MKSPTTLALLLTAIEATMIAAPTGTTRQAPESEVRTIMTRAIERASWGQEQDSPLSFADR